MLARFGKCLIVFALVLNTGAHWAALQTVAWTTMLANNLRSDSLTEAVSKTFDGEHSCCLCKALAAAKQAEKKSEAVAPVLKMEFPPVAENSSLFPPTQFKLLRPQNIFANWFSTPPPVPPPRSFYV